MKGYTRSEDKMVRGFSLPLVRTRSLIILAIWVGIAVTGCYRTKVEKMKEYHPVDQFPRPDNILVYDFAISQDDVYLNRGLPARVVRKLEGELPSEEEIKIGRKVAEILSKKLVEELHKMGLPAELVVGPGGETPPSEDNVLIIKGAFLRVDEGNRLRRLVIGFGLGATDVRTGVGVYAEKYDEDHLLETFETEVESSLKPGVVVTAPAGIATAGVATGAAVGGAMVLSGGYLGSVEALTDQTAKKIVRVLLELYSSKGWILPEQANP